MAKERGRRLASALLVLGAVVFGMVLAGGLDWTTPGFGAIGQDAGAVAVTGRGAALPGFADLAEAVAPAVASIRSVSFQEAPGGEGGRGEGENEHDLRGKRSHGRGLVRVAGFEPATLSSGG